MRYKSVGFEPEGKKYARRCHDQDLQPSPARRVLCAMMAVQRALVLVCGLLLQLRWAAAGSSSSGLERGPGRRTQHASSDAVRRALSRYVMERGDETILSNTSTFAKSFDSATLYEDSLITLTLYSNRDVPGGSISESIQVICSTCYIKGVASVDVTTSGGFNFTQAVQNVTSAVGNFIENITETIVKDVVNVTETMFSNVFTQGQFNFADLHFPSLDYSLNVDVQAIPECHVQFGFDELELYMLMDTTMTSNGSWRFNLYTSESPMGVALGQDLQLGVFFTVDLLLDVSDAIDIGSGFHLRLENGATIDINMFDTNVSSIAVKGGHFEFLPVTLNSGTTTMTAILRLGMHVGIEMQSHEIDLPDTPIQIGSLSAGLELGVFADLAEFTSTFNESLTNDKTECDFMGQQAYQFALGADAGATLALGDHVWGPAPTTTVPLYYTTLTDVCIGHKATSTAPPGSGTGPMTAPSASATLPPPAKRQGAAATATAMTMTTTTTTTLTTQVLYTAVQCPRDTPLCPVSQQTTSVVTRTSTLVAAVPSGSAATFPPTTADAVSATIPFGTGAQAIFSSSGRPVSYVPPPPPPPTSSAGGGAGSGSGGAGGEGSGIFGLGTEGGLSAEQRKIAIGVGVGVGVPLLVGIALGVVFFVRTRKRSRSSVAYTACSPGVDYGTDWVNGTLPAKEKGGPLVSVVEQPSRSVFASKNPRFSTPEGLSYGAETFE